MGGNNMRLFVWMSLFAMMWFAYRAWLLDYPPPTVAAPEQLPTAEATAPPQLPQADAAENSPPTPPTPAGTPGAVEPPQADAPAPDRVIRVSTDVLDIMIDLQGGDLIRADLPLYPLDKDNPDMPVRLLDYPMDSRWVFESGFTSAADDDEPNHLASYTSARTEYVLADGADELVVSLDWQGSGSLSGQKIYTFRRGEYAVDLDLVVSNSANASWSAAPYVRLFRRHIPVDRSYTSVDSYSFTGPVLYDGEEYEKLDVEDLVTVPIDQTLAGGWLASIQHHFLAAAVPPPEDQVRYQAQTRGSDYLLTALSPVLDVAAGASETYPVKLFVGPKLQDQLAAAGDELELTVDYGVLTILAQPLFWLLSKVHGFVNNWGWSIIIVTMLIKLAFYKLTQTSGRSMAKMRKLQPRMKALQERFKDDRQALSQAMMELYKKEKVNPAAGCLPILIQMPFFFAFYWVLIESVEIRQAPFALWISDLSSRDPYFILPLLMGGAMLLQTRLNPAPPDPVQAKVMQIMPVAFTALFAFFPAGLVLYWLTNTALSILQQWRINKVIGAD
ncbi:MAG: membrane protein insertase YidC [Candidatus Rariloculaceae bacterium]